MSDNTQAWLSLLIQTKFLWTCSKYEDAVIKAKRSSQIARMEIPENNRCVFAGPSVCGASLLLFLAIIVLA